MFFPFQNHSRLQQQQQQVELEQQLQKEQTQLHKKQQLQQQHDEQQQEQTQQPLQTSQNKGHIIEKVIVVMKTDSSKYPNVGMALKTSPSGNVTASQIYDAVRYATYVFLDI